MRDNRDLSWQSHNQVQKSYDYAMKASESLYEENKTLKAKLQKQIIGDQDSTFTNDVMKVIIAFKGINSLSDLTEGKFQNIQKLIKHLEDKLK